MYGAEDRFLFSLGSGWDCLHANEGHEKSYPVYVKDVGRAIQTIAYDDSTAGETFELHGPREWSKEQLIHLIEGMTLQKNRHYHLPAGLLKLFAKTINSTIWWPSWSEDEIVRQFIDQKIDPTAKTFKDLGIEPAEVDSVGHYYMRYFRYVFPSFKVLFLTCLDPTRTRICRQ